MAKKSATKTLLLEIPVAPIAARSSSFNINDDIQVDIRLDQRQSNALRYLFAGLKASMKYPLHRPAMGLVWFLEEIAAQMEPQSDV